MFTGLKKLFEKDGAQETRVVATNLEGLSRQKQQETIQAIVNASGVPQHKGIAEHGYSLAKVATPEKCPRCRAATELRYAGFVYATQKKPRVMDAPAGHFCTRCSTVIVDEELLSSGVSRGYEYRSVIGIESADKKETPFFKTWNGQEMIIFLDEVEETMNLIPKNMLQPIPQRPPATSKQKALKEARRKALAKASRKRNRK